MYMKANLVNLSDLVGYFMFIVAELQSASVIFQTSNMHVQDKTYFINGCANLANIRRNAAHCSSSIVPQTATQK